MKWTTISLVCIVLLACFLRFYKIDQIPVSLYWDEAAMGYNAYTIAQTGQDEYGNAFPFLFESFNDYKMPGAIYLMAVIVKIFGLSEFTVRFISALLGTLTVVCTYFLVLALFNGDTYKKNEKQNHFIWNASLVGLVTAFLLAISPWHIQFSRTSFEANVGVFFIVLGVWSFLRGLSFSIFYYISMISFGISMYMYRSIDVFLPLLLLSLYVIFRKRLTFKKFIIGNILLLCIIAPFIPHILSPDGMKRVQQVNISMNIQEDLYKNSLAIQKEGNTVWNRIIYNRRFVYVQTFINEYISHFSPKFLFLEGDSNGRHGPRGMGLLYYWELPFLLIGLYALLRYAPNSSIKAIVLLWIVIALIPASFSIPAPHALRSLNVLPMPQLLIAMGLWFCYTKVLSKKRLLFISVVGIFILGCFLNYLYLYYEKTPKITASAWADGHKQLTTYVFANEKSYDKILITGEYWQPYIYFLFYKKYDPSLFQKYGTNRKFDKYVFGGTSWDKEQYHQTLESVDLAEFAGSKNTLVVLSPKEYSMQKDHIEKLTDIRNNNNELVFIVGKLL